MATQLKTVFAPDEDHYRDIIGGPGEHKFWKSLEDGNPVDVVLHDSREAPGDNFPARLNFDGILRGIPSRHHVRDGWETKGRVQRILDEGGLGPVEYYYGSYNPRPRSGDRDRGAVYPIQELIMQHTILGCLDVTELASSAWRHMEPGERVQPWWRKAGFVKKHTGDPRDQYELWMMYASAPGQPLVALRLGIGGYDGGTRHWAEFHGLPKTAE